MPHSLASPDRVTVPTPIFGTTELDIRMIDTRGVDEPSAPDATCKRIWMTSEP